MGQVHTLIGRGIYDVEEIAHLIGATTRQVSRWAGPASHGGGLLLPDERGLLTFWDLITARVALTLQRQGVSTSSTRDARDHLRASLDFDWPLAHYAGLRRLGRSGRDVYAIEYDGEWTDVSRGGQRPFAGVIDPWIIRVDFEPLGPAASWTPVDGVVLDPKVQAGAPCLDGTRLTTKTIAELHDGGDSVEDIAWAYELEADLVQRAIDYERSLNEAA